MKNKKFAKRSLAVIAVIINFTLLVTLIVANIRSYKRTEALYNKVAYLQDTTDIIKSDINTMDENIKATLEEESSLIEDYSYKVADCDFEAKTYDVEINIMPKEYTDSTITSIYFGTHEYLLSLSGHSYSGTIRLPMSVSYDDNVTVLFTNGDKKNTEVLAGFVGFQSKLEDALIASMDTRAISYSAGKLSVDVSVDYSLDGGNDFEFESMDLIVEAGDEVIYDYDLFLESGGLIEKSEDDEESLDDSLSDAEECDTDSFNMANMSMTEGITSSDKATDTSDSSNSYNASSNTSNDKTSTSLMASLDGEQAVNFSREVDGGNKLSIYIKAVTNNGLTFEYELYHSYTKADKKGFVDNLTSYDTNYIVYDKNGKKWRL